MNRQDLTALTEAYMDQTERLGDMFKSPERQVVSNDVKDTVNDVLNFIESDEIPKAIKDKLAEYLQSDDFDRSVAASEIGRLYGSYDV